MSYRQLTPEQRYQIGACLKIGMKRSEIAKEIKVHRSTVTREIKRNSTPYRYNPSWAIAVAMGRHAGKLKKRIDSDIWMRVDSLLRLDWSPEQVSERLKLEGFGRVSHETIYLHIYKNKAAGGDLYKHLRRRHMYRKRIHKYCKRLGWDARRPISERPPVVETRSRLGDWEADTIIGREKKGGILSLVERRSRYCLLQKIPTKSSVTVAEAICRKLLPHADKVLTITSDNGHEFMHHQRIALNLSADFFFADPYSSWQRGTVENTNGLVRQYIPKGSTIDAFSDDDIQAVTRRLNNRPRKCLRFQTPNEVFFNQPVALIT